MGWFGTPDFYMTPHMLFSSPSGDGLVPDEELYDLFLEEIFVPAWGWVGSINGKYELQLSTFSSPSGDGVVLIDGTRFKIEQIFSSPFGDGLVLKEYTLNENLYNIFVPAWGWVGSLKRKE